MEDHYVPKDAGTPICPVCADALVFEVYPGYEYNEWRSYCPNDDCSARGYINVDYARFVDRLQAT